MPHFYRHDSSHYHSNQRQKASATISGELDGALGVALRY